MLAEAASMREDADQETLLPSSTQVSAVHELLPKPRRGLKVPAMAAAAALLATALLAAALLAKAKAKVPESKWALLAKAEAKVPPEHRFSPTQGEGGTLSAKSSSDICKDDGYTSSPLENDFREHINAWAGIDKEIYEHLKEWDPTELCAHMGSNADSWIKQNKGQEPASLQIFSTLCKKGRNPELIEPLAGILRDPRFPCQYAGDNLSSLLFSIEWLVMADESVYQAHGKKLFFDAGGSRFADATLFFASHYENRGIVFDHIYVWEADEQSEEDYWIGVSADMRAKWEPRVTFYNGIPVTAEPGHEHNVVERIYKMCEQDDFCAFKLDIDTPSVELPIVQQLLAQPGQTSAALDEFFFEHHVHGIMQIYGWGDNVNSTFADTIDIFTKLRQMGVRCHSWI